MKVYRKVVMSMVTLQVIEEDWYEYEGEVAQCKGGGSSTTTTSVPEWQQPYLTDIYQRALQQSYKPISYYSGNTVAGFTPEQQVAQGLTTSRALSGSPLLRAAQETTQKTVQGDFLSPETNPWLEKTYEQSARDLTNKFTQATLPNIRSSAMGAGAYGGSRHGVAEGMAYRGLQEELSDLATNIYGGAYESERNRMQNALSLAQPLAEADYADIARLSAVGEEKQAMEQALIDEMIKRYEFEQLEPWQRLGMYSNLVTGDVGGTTTSMRSGK
jgi:hypothetical protein